MALEIKSHIHRFFKGNKLRKKISFYLFTIIASVAISIVLSYNGFVYSNPDSARYTISALIQSEAAILAIIVTLSLVAVQQTASCYSPRVTEIFKDKNRNPDFWIIMVIYIGAMIYGAFILKQIGEGDLYLANAFQKYLPTEIVYVLFDIQTAIWFTFFLSIIAFTSLWVYIKNTLELLNPSKIIEILAEDITEERFKLAANRKHTRDYDDRDPIHPIIDIVSNSLINVDNQTALKGILNIEERTKQIFKSINIDVEDFKGILENFLNHFTIVGKLAVKKDNEDFVLKVLPNLHNVCNIAIKQKMLSTSVIATESLGQLGKASVEEKMNDSASMSIHFLRQISEISVENKLGYLATKAIGSLDQIGKAAIDQKMVPLSIKIVDVLEKIGDISIEQNAQMSSISICDLKKNKYVLPKVVNSINELFKTSYYLNLNSIQKEANKAKQKFNGELKSKGYDTRNSEFISWVLESNANFELEQYEEAFKDIQRALDLKKDISDALILKGDILLEQNRNYEASKAYDEGHHKAKMDILNNVISLVFKGMALSKLGRYDETFDAYDKALELKPGDSFIYYNKGSTFFELGQYEEASENCGKAIQIDPKNIYALILREVISKKVKLCGNLKSSDNFEIRANPLEFFQVGNYLLKIGRYSEALVAYEKAIEIKQDFALAWLSKGLSLYHLKEYRAALDTYEEVLSIKEDYALAHSEKGNVYFKLGLYKDSLGQYKNALEVLKRELNPDQFAIADNFNRIADVYKNIALTQNEETQCQKSYEEAISWYEKALYIRKHVLGTDHPLVAHTLKSLALIYEKENRYEDAEPLYKQSMRIFEQVLDPDHFEYLQNLDRLADFYIKQKNYEDAIPLIERGLKIRTRTLPFDHPEVIEYLGKLESLYERTKRYADSYSLYMQIRSILEQSSMSADHIEEISNRLTYFGKEMGKLNFEDLHKRATDSNPNIKKKVAHLLGSSLQYIAEKDEVWNDLHELTLDQDIHVRKNAVISLATYFQYIPDKQQAWEDLHRLTFDPNNIVKSSAASSLGIAFPYLPNENQECDDLRRLSNDKDKFVRSSAASSLGTAFPHIPDKQQAWEVLHKLTMDMYTEVRWNAADSLNLAFPHIPDKQQAWEDLHRLTFDESNYVRWSTAKSFGLSFQYIPDKEKAWEDLHRLAGDEENDVKEGAAYSLGTAFPHISNNSNQKQAFEDMLRLANDEDSGVRERATSSLGSIYQHTSDKKQVLKKLYELTNDEENDVEAAANYYLGKIHIFKASQSGTEKSYKEELENAINYFQISSDCSVFKNPSRFCLPFYRAFYTIIFKNKSSKDEIDRYIDDAKYSIGNSKNKALLLEAVENLANALKEVQHLEDLDLTKKKDNLYIYRKHCENITEITKDTEKLAPSATRVMRKGLPILDRKLKELLEEIQEKVKTACQVSKGTDTEEIVCAVSQEVQKWEIGSQEEMSWFVENLVFTLESSIPNIPNNQRIFDRIHQIREQNDIVKQYSILSSIIPMIPMVHIENNISELKEKNNEVKEENNS
ncbi:DUF2254 family protein [Methanosarcina sp. Mfa9]|uniref:DUF2254 family protein n=1 Tax=Methanosarcina sp. Mfa9 TaxID=3439063 RepID=UPI003F83DB22